MKLGTVSLSDPLVDPFFLFNFSLAYMSILHACMSVHHVHESLLRPEESISTTGGGGLELKIVSRHCLGAGNQTQVFLEEHLVSALTC